MHRARAKLELRADLEVCMHAGLWRGVVMVVVVVVVVG